MKQGLQFDSRQISSSSNEFREYRLPVSIAKNEIVELRSMFCGLEIGYTSDSARVYFSEKSVTADAGLVPEDENDLVSDKHTFWRIARKLALTTSGSTIYTENAFIYFDPPLYLVRQPRACIIGSGSGGGTTYANIWVYYTKSIVSRNEIVKFMVKRHH